MPPPGAQVLEPSAIVLMLFGIIAMSLMRQKLRK
ncbi:MAG: PEP-CTERM sorting domain-containing protein [Deltaproteobacteria bacterium]